MPTIAEVRAQYPQYDDMNDEELAGALHKKFYSDMPRDTFNDKIGLKPDDSPENWRRGSVLPLSRNIKTGELSLSLPSSLDSVYNLATGKTPLQAYDPTTGQVHTSPEAIKGGMDTAMTVAGPSPAKAAIKEIPAIAKTGLNAIDAGARKILPEPKPVPERPAIIASEEWQKTKQKAYKEVDDSGMLYSPQGYDRLLSNIDKLAEAGRINPKRHPKASSMIEDMKKETGSPKTLTALDQWRQIVRRDVKGDEAESFFGNQIIDSIDDFIANPSLGDVAVGDAKKAVKLILGARKANSIYRKTEEIEDAVADARRATQRSGSGGNLDNNIRNAVDKILRNKRRVRFFDKQEKTAMEALVKGDSWHNFARMVGKLSPEGNGLALLMHGLTGIPAAISTGGLSALGQIPLAAAGFGAKRYAERESERNVEELLRLIQAKANQ